MDNFSFVEVSNASPRTESAPSTPKFVQKLPSAPSSPLLFSGELKQSPQLRRLLSQNNLPPAHEIASQNKAQVRK